MLEDSKKDGIISQITNRLLAIEAFVRNHKVQNHVKGSIVQVAYFQTGTVATGSTTVPVDNTIPQNTEGDQYMSLAFTPQSATNILTIEVNTTFASDTVRNVVVALFKDSVANALSAIVQSVAAVNLIITTSFKHEMVAGTVSPITFKVRAGPGGAATLTFNGAGAGQFMGGVMASSIRITERKP